ncbi:MAG: hypothetical protein PWQ82_514 [Thermosediminibacterales bacterium]|nr:hypothetical protein [Thermosediminibacterales bacterium]
MFKFLYGQWLLSSLLIGLSPPSSSNSSMVNGYSYFHPIHLLTSIVQIPLWSMVTRTGIPFEFILAQVQIPLWSMVTRNTETYSTIITRFKFLYGQWLLVGELPIRYTYKLVQIPLWSMVTLFLQCRISKGMKVQIPLWSMVTFSMSPLSMMNALFKFLYGQWLPMLGLILLRFLASSNSSMVNGYVPESPV